MSIIRQPVHAGKFFAADPRKLTSDVRKMLDAIEPAKCQPKILIAPHAGFVYSGPVAASAYATLISRHSTITRVIILGTCHVDGVFNIATTNVDSFATPLGFVETDVGSIKSAVDQGLAVVDDRAHQIDHAIEVQLPFLQTVLDKFKIVPGLVGHVPTEQVASFMRLMWGGRETVFVISSDLSHWLPYEQARAVDQKTSDYILDFQAEKLDVRRACGFRAIAGVLQVAREKSLECRQLDLRNSGDTAGPKDRVVGYGAFAFCEPSSSSAKESR